MDREGRIQVAKQPIGLVDSDGCLHRSWGAVSPPVGLWDTLSHEPESLGASLSEEEALDLLAIAAVAQASLREAEARD
jgi:hypothetical protein